MPDKASSQIHGALWPAPEKLALARHASAQALCQPEAEAAQLLRPHPFPIDQPVDLSLLFATDRASCNQEQRAESKAVDLHPGRNSVKTGE